MNGPLVQFIICVLLRVCTDGSKNKERLPNSGTKAADARDKFSSREATRALNVKFRVSKGIALLIGLSGPCIFFF